MNKLSEIAESLDLKILNILTKNQAISSLQQAEPYLRQWQSRGFGAAMSYMLRDLSFYNSLEPLLSSVKSVICFGAPYSNSLPLERVQLSGLSQKELCNGAAPFGFGRIARFAWGQDYHKSFKQKLGKFVERVEAVFKFKSPIHYRAFSDAVPVLEKTLALSQSRVGGGGLNPMLIRGANSILIHPDYGSFIVLGELLWDVELDLANDRLGGCDTGSILSPRRNQSSGLFQEGKLLAGAGFKPALVNEERSNVPFCQDRHKAGLCHSLQGVVTRTEGQPRCNSCHHCVSACPGGALHSAPFVDANRCVSYLTIEKKEAFSALEQRLIGSWIFGCDVCQEVCSYNQAHLVTKKTVAEFDSQSGPGPFISLKELFSLRSNRQFVVRFKGTALMRAGRKKLLRNACCVVANQNETSLIAPIIDLVENEADPILRKQALDSLRLLLEIASGIDRIKIKGVLERHSVGSCAIDS